MNIAFFRWGVKPTLSAVLLTLTAASQAYPVSNTTTLPQFRAGAPKKDPNLTTLPSGVTIKHLFKGTGVTPSAMDTVRLHYTGKLADGQVFDTSMNGEPLTIAMGMAIPCWTQALQRIQVGSNVILTCPADTAHGFRGANTPPKGRLTFQVNLLAAYPADMDPAAVKAKRQALKR